MIADLYRNAAPVSIQGTSAGSARCPLPFLSTALPCRQLQREQTATTSALQPITPVHGLIGLYVDRLLISADFVMDEITLLRGFVLGG